jgi:hypothetical protein
MPIIAPGSRERSASRVVEVMQHYPAEARIGARVR